ncbi:MAG TPA: hypothetical protein ENJ32_11790 [Crenotrichaceae bacterium]|nr:hypothetical protein [Crenotrichaceae bacterium]
MKENILCLENKEIAHKRMNQSISQSDPSTLAKLKDIIHKILPLVDDVADALGVFLLVSLLMTGWIFTYLLYFQHISFAISLSIAGCALLPWLILLRIWFALENLKQVPENLSELVDDVSDSTSQSVRAIKSGKKGFINVVGQARKLFQIRSLLKSGREVIEQYFSIGPLINPFYLLFAVISLISLFVVIITGSLLAVVAAI